MSEPLVIVGNGMAAARLVEELTTRALGRHAIAVIGDEPSLAYNRVLLSSLLAREVAEADIELKPRHWWEEAGVTLLYGRRATEIDPRARLVRLEGGTKLVYAKLVLATGSEPIRLPLPGVELQGVLAFRDIRDVETILTSTRSRTRAIVIGGGLLGLEAAWGLKKAGADVTVVHLMDRLMERQLDKRASAILERAFNERGIKVLLNAESAAIHGGKKVGGLRLEDGRLLDADLIVMAAGIRPNANLAQTAGLTVNRGIVVDDCLETSIPGIYAIGECAEHRGICYGLVEPAYAQARVLADHLSGREASYRGSLLATNLKVSGINVFSAGDFLCSAESEPIVLEDGDRGTYRKLVTRGGKLTGAILIGDTADALWYLDLIRSGRALAAIRDGLAFGRAFCEQATPLAPSELIHAEAA